MTWIEALIEVLFKPRMKYFDCTGDRATVVWRAFDAAKRRP